MSLIEKYTSLHNEKNVKILHSSLFYNSQKQMQPKYSSTVEWTDKLQWIHTIKSYIAMKMGKSGATCNNSEGTLVKHCET